MSDYRGIYHKKNVEKGAIYIRDQRNIVQPATIYLKNIYDNFIRAADYLYATNITTELISGIKDFEIWFDTLMIQTENFVFLTKLGYDYDTNEIVNSLDDIHIISLQKTKFSEPWFFPEDKRLVLCTLVSCGSAIYPILRDYNIENNTMSILYNKSYETDSINKYYYKTYEEPILSYNYKTKTYNIAFISYSSLTQYNSGVYNGMFTNIINIQNTGSTYAITKIEITVPIILGE